MADKMGGRIGVEMIRPRFNGVRFPSLERNGDGLCRGGPSRPSLFALSCLELANAYKRLPAVQLVRAFGNDGRSNRTDKTAARRLGFFDMTFSFSSSWYSVYQRSDRDSALQHEPVAPRLASRHAQNAGLRAAGATKVVDLWFIALKPAACRLDSET